MKPEPRKKLFAWLNRKDTELFRKMRLKFTEVNGMPWKTGIWLVGRGVTPDPEDIRRYAGAGGTVFYLSRKESETIPGFHLRKGTAGKTTELPDWKAARGLSLSDLHLKTDFPTNLLTPDKKESRIAAGGLLGYRPLGKGEILAVQLLPDELNAKEKDYYKFSAWRRTRTFAQLLTNAGAEFEADREFFSRQRESLAAKELTLPAKWLAHSEYQVPRVPGRKVIDPGNKGIKSGWHKPDFDDSKWKPIRTSALFQDQDGFPDVNGILWYRLKFTVPKEFKGRQLQLDLGLIDDMDDTYFNGVRIGGTNAYHLSVYLVNHYLVNYGGENTLAVRLFDNNGKGGIMGIPMLRQHIPPRQSPFWHLYSGDYNDQEDGDDVFRFRGW